MRTFFGSLILFTSMYIYIVAGGEFTLSLEPSRLDESDSTRTFGDWINTSNSLSLDGKSTHLDYQSSGWNERICVTDFSPNNSPFLDDSVNLVRVIGDVRYGMKLERSGIQVAAFLIRESTPFSLKTLSRDGFIYGDQFNSAGDAAWTPSELKLGGITMFEEIWGPEPAAQDFSVCIDVDLPDSTGSTTTSGGSSGSGDTRDDSVIIQPTEPFAPRTTSIKTISRLTSATEGPSPVSAMQDFAIDFVGLDVIVSVTPITTSIDKSTIFTGDVINLSGSGYFYLDQNYPRITPSIVPVVTINDVEQTVVSHDGWNALTVEISNSVPVASNTTVYVRVSVDNGVSFGPGKEIIWEEPEPEPEPEKSDNEDEVTTDTPFDTMLATTILVGGGAFVVFVVMGASLFASRSRSVTFADESDPESDNSLAKKPKYLGAENRGSINSAVSLPSSSEDDSNITDPTLKSIDSLTDDTTSVGSAQSDWSTADGDLDGEQLFSTIPVSRFTTQDSGHVSSSDDDTGDMSERSFHSTNSSMAPNIGYAVIQP